MPVEIFFLFLFLFFFLFSSPATSLSASLSFNFTNFESHENKGSINTTGDAYISPQGIQLTPNEFNVLQNFTVGRATYISPLHLWERKSGNLCDFSTRFSFVINSRGQTAFADGITFFLAPVYSSIKSPNALGGSIGLNTDDNNRNSSSETFFAVEFDTFQNFFDPSRSHVGININSMVSVATANWQNDIPRGRENEAWISYSGTSKILSVNFTNFLNNTVTQGTLSTVIDLRSIMPEQVIFGFSGATGTLFEINTINSWDFSSNLTLDTTSTVPASGPIPDPPISIGDGRRNKKRGVGGLAIGLGVGLPIIILLLGFAGCFLKKKYKKESTDHMHTYAIDPSMDSEFQRGTGAKKFVYAELARGTNNFSEELKLGEGGFGGVYRGFLKETNSYVAVKRVSSGSQQGLKEYASEVKIISQLRHRNLVQLIGWCHERGELLLVYEFLPNGSLDSHIFKHNSVLTWEVRYKIAQGLASALLYLHEEWDQCVVHRDIKSSNIMLDSNFNAKLGDFGLARLVDHDKGSQTTIVAGTRGYMAPEYVISGRASKESDVYSFGVVLLEITCGRKAIEARFQENNIVMLVEWVWKLYGAGNILEAVDQDLGMEQNSEVMERLLVVGLWCVHPDNRHRPTIRQAMNAMNFEAQLPVLPAMMPVPIYYSPSMSMVTGSSVSYSDSSNITSSSAGSSDPSTALLKTS